MANYTYYRTFFASYDISAFTTANAKVVTTQTGLQEAIGTYLQNFISRWPRFTEITYDFAAAINNTARRIYIYITCKNYRLNLGAGTDEIASLGQIQTGKYNGTRHLLGAVIDKALVTTTNTDILLSSTNTCTIWTSDTYRALPTTMFGSIIFTGFTYLGPQLTTAGYLFHIISVNKTVYEEGNETQIRLNHYSEIKSPSQAINAVTLQQDPNQIVLNDETADNTVMK
jgi:hypothetical protein